MSDQKYHILMPIARFDNLKSIIDMLEDQNSNVELHLLIDSTSSVPTLPLPDWVKVHTFVNDGKEFWQRCNNIINIYIDQTDLVDDDKYLILNDDDFYEPGFFDKLDELSEHDIIVCSMERGNRTPPQSDPVKAHPTYKLYAVKSSMHPCGVGVEQIIIAGKILKCYRLPLHNCGDGLMIERICRERHVHYAPHINVWFNYLEEGRWE